MHATTTHLHLLTNCHGKQILSHFIHPFQTLYRKLQLDLGLACEQFLHRVPSLLPAFTSNIRYVSCLDQHRWPVSALRNTVVVSLMEGEPEHVMPLLRWYGDSVCPDAQTTALARVGARAAVRQLLHSTSTAQPFLDASCQHISYFFFSHLCLEVRFIAHLATRGNHDCDVQMQRRT